MNAGSVDGSTTEPATTALVTYTGGDWVAATDIFTAAVGADMTEAVVGRFASLYVDGDTTPTANQYLVARITAVNAGTRAITLSTTARALLGTEVADGTGTRSLRIGGAWAGMAGASAFPFTLTGHANLTGTAGDAACVNLKNDQTYSTSVEVLSAGHVSIRGYASTYGDQGRATIDGSTNAIILLRHSGSAGNFRMVTDLILTSSATTGTNAAFSNGLPLIAERVTCKGARGAGFLVTGGYAVTLLECEAVDCNKANSASSGGFTTTGNTTYVRCVSHNNAGSNNNGWVLGGSTSELINVLEDCVADTNGLHGVLQLTTANDVFSQNFVIRGGVYYGNGTDGVRIAAPSSTGRIRAVIENAAFEGNTGAGIGLSAASTITFVRVVNCGFYSNGSETTNLSSDLVTGSVSFASSSVTDAANGNFVVTLSTAKWAGKGAYVQDASTYSSTTTAKPDIGLQHEETASGGGYKHPGMTGGLNA